MPKMRLIPVLVGCIIAVLAGVVPARAADRPNFDDVSSILQRVVDSGRVSGVSLIIVDKDDHVLYENAFGTLSITSVVPLESASKVPSVSAIMTLVDHKKLALNDHVTKYLSYWPKDHNKNKITLKQLLSHTSGLLGLPQMPSCYHDKSEKLDQCVQQFDQSPLLADPGTAFNYGGADFQVAGAIAQAVAHKSWATFFHDAIAKPCGLKTFSFGSKSNPWVAADGLSDLADYGRILAMHLSGGMCGHTRVLSKQAVAQMQQDQTGKAKILYSPWKDDRHYGLGWWLTPPASGQKVTEFSDDGSKGSIPWIDTARGYGAALFMNDRWAVALRIKALIEPMIDQDLGQP